MHNLRVTCNFNSLTPNHNLSFVHYNLQSIYTKLQYLYAELVEFDILVFSETWLNPSINTENLILESYQSPERKDRNGDSQGRTILYVKEGVYYKSKNDSEFQEIENIWIEVKIIRSTFYLVCFTGHRNLILNISHV